MMELRSVVKTYATAGGSGVFRALNGISARFSDGELTVILGPSGSGKSTLLRLFNRMIEPDSGEVIIDGSTARSLDPVALRRSMGYVIQNVGLFPHMSVAGNISVVPSLLGWTRERIGTRVAELLDLVRLPRTYAGRRPHQLSGGEAQRVGVARALAADPRVLLMDEPFGALDALTREDLQDEFIRIQKELRKTVIFVTHDVGEAVRLADTILVMKGGRLAGVGTPAQLARNFTGTFVQEFLGTRFEIELLGRKSAAARADFSPAGATRAAALVSAAVAAALAAPAFPEAAVPAAVPLCSSATLHDALAMMLATASTEIAVSGADGRLGWLSLDMIVSGSAESFRNGT